MSSLSKDMKLRAKLVAQFMKTDYPTIRKVEALKHFKNSFIHEGFTDSSLVKWKKRSSTDKFGRTNIRYRTNRVGKAGAPNKKGRNIIGRPTLTGKGSSGNKLRNSLNGRVENGQAIIYTYVHYAEYHNEGISPQPKRMFMGESAVLDKAIQKKVDIQIKKIFGE